MPVPSEPRPPHDGPVLEPIRVLRPRRTDALAELMREFRGETGREPAYESVALPGPPPGSQDSTRELPPVGGDGGPRRSGPPVAGTARRPTSAHRADASGGAGGRRRTAVAAAVLAAAAIGFAGATLVHREHGDPAAAPAPRPPASAPATAPTSGSAPAPTPPVPDPDGAGTLREGATGPAVTDLQQRLLRIPDVYRDGSTSGRYDPVLTAAVARFQLWYGVSGDETGVYGDDTRAALESRTAPVTS
ncbi:peptidoglycan-binding protein [Streptomyces sp. NPDC003456]|uniref:peptidoglycan-binding domain-containing protein n=1 Tax=Streptomyces sp. NPDC003456 TaxID=3364683 RepID=UPI0036A67256